MLRTLTYVLGKEAWQGCTWREDNCGVSLPFPPREFPLGTELRAPRTIPTG